MFWLFRVSRSYILSHGVCWFSLFSFSCYGFVLDGSTEAMSGQRFSHRSWSADSSDKKLARYCSYQVHHDVTQSCYNIQRVDGGLALDCVSTKLSSIPLSTGADSEVTTKDSPNKVWLRPWHWNLLQPAHTSHKLSNTAPDWRLETSRLCIYVCM